MNASKGASSKGVIGILLWIFVTALPTMQANLYRARLFGNGSCRSKNKRGSCSPHFQRYTSINHNNGRNNGKAWIGTTWSGGTTERRWKAGRIRQSKACKYFASLSLASLVSSLPRKLALRSKSRKTRGRDKRCISREAKPIFWHSGKGFGFDQFQNDLRALSRCFKIWLGNGIPAWDRRLTSGEYLETDYSIVHKSITVEMCGIEEDSAFLLLLLKYCGSR